MKNTLPGLEKPMRVISNFDTMKASIMGRITDFEMRATLELTWCPP
jgi:hypothetical protein